MTKTSNQMKLNKEKKSRKFNSSQSPIIKCHTDKLSLTDK